MLFNSLTFLIFLPIVFTIYWALGIIRHRGQWLQNIFVVIASYVFYGWWDWRFLLLIFLTSVWAYSSGLLMVGSVKLGRRKFIVFLALVINLGILGAFKYYNFFVGNFISLLNAFGLSVRPTLIKIILPVGISFYTFQALSYVIDVYRNKIAATKDLFAFLAFVSFFPQLVAGPIERATNLLPQFLESRRFDYALAVDGCRQMLWGFFKKLVVADGCAFAANNILNTDVNSSVSLLVGLFCFTIQIYGDFSGYSDIAIGISKTFGIRLKRNFAVPYFSRDIGEFWRRWHMSLTTWFKDYLYIPLGGSREGLVKTIRNTFIVFLVSGFWHGASWTFIVWGLVHAIAFLPSLIRGTNRRYAGMQIAEGRLLPTPSEAFGMMRTFLVVMLGWAFFRGETVAQAWYWIREILLGFNLNPAPLSGKGVPHAIIWALIMLAVEWFNRNREYGFSIYPKQMFLRRAIYIGMIVLMILNVSPRQSFIYFQF